jgi:hypothetical protein
MSRKQLRKKHLQLRRKHRNHWTYKGMRILLFIYVCFSSSGARRKLTRGLRYVAQSSLCPVAKFLKAESGSHAYDLNIGGIRLPDILPAFILVITVILMCVAHGALAFFHGNHEIEKFAYKMIFWTTITAILTRLYSRYIKDVEEERKTENDDDIIEP